MNGRATLGERAEGGVERDEQLRLRLGDRRDLGGGRRERVDEPLEAGAAGRRGCASPARAARAPPGRLAERRVERRAAAGERVAELEQVLPGSRPASARRRCSGPRRSRPARASRRRAAAPRPAGSPRSKSPWSISRYLRPSAERARTITVESTGSGSTSLSSFRSSRALTLPSVVLHRARSPRPRRRARRRPGPRCPAPAGRRSGPRPRSGRWARTAARVRVVGEEDGEDHDQHRDRADHRRARGEALTTPRAPHRGLPLVGPIRKSSSVRGAAVRRRSGAGIGVGVARRRRRARAARARRLGARPSARADPALGRAAARLGPSARLRSPFDLSGSLAAASLRRARSRRRRAVAGLR